VTARERLTKAQREQWEAVVEAVLGNEDVDLPAYKRKAVLWARSKGCSAETIINLGQSVVLSRYAKFRKSGYGRDRVLRWKISASLADAIQPERNSNRDAEEPLQSRIARLTGIRTSEEFWSFVHSFFGEVSDLEIINHAGEGDADKPTRP
jgi:hypothetical protein